MPRSPRLAHKASVMEAKSSVHRLVFIVFNYNFSAFLCGKNFPFKQMFCNFYNALLVLYGLDKPSFTAKLKKEIRFEQFTKQFES